MWVRERDVDEDALHDHEDTGAVDGNADRGRDPMDGGVRGPGEEEEPDGWTEGSEQGRHQSVFLCTKSVFLNVWDQIEVEISAVCSDARNA